MFKGTQTGEGFEGSKVVSFGGTLSKAGIGFLSTGKGRGAEGQGLGKVKCAWQWRGEGFLQAKEQRYIYKHCRGRTRQAKPKRLENIFLK